MNARLIALQALLQVTQHGQSLSQALPPLLERLTDRRDRGFVQTLVMGTLRFYPRLVAIRQQLMSKPLKNKDEDINSLLLLALFQLTYLDTAAHAAVSESVNLCQKLKKPWARGLVNACLRGFIRERETLLQALPKNAVVEYSHPAWLIAQLQQHYPDDWHSILQQNNQPAPLCLRVNRRRQARDAFLAGLQQCAIDAQAHPLSPDAISLAQSLDITQLPGFAEGDFSVQDVAAQQAALILQPQPGQRLLDACAAPGGKTTHLLEYCDNQAELLALEKEPTRLSRLQDNLARLHLNADCRVADAANRAAWWDGQTFDHILLDAPCSATGIIRRHPDIKHHRRAEDIEALVATQAALLDQLWPTLKPGGTLLYATCSVLPCENTQQIAAFLQRQADAEHLPLAQPVSHSRLGWQILPGEQGMDGFFYAHLRKRA